jgi:hypothetical protein
MLVLCFYTLKNCDIINRLIPGVLYWQFQSQTIKRLFQFQLSLLEARRLDLNSVLGSDIFYK